MHRQPTTSRQGAEAGEATTEGGGDGGAVVPVDFSDQLRLDAMATLKANPDFTLLPTSWQALWTVLQKDPKMKGIGKLCICDLPYAQAEEPANSDLKGLRSLFDWTIKPGGVLILFLNINSWSKFRQMMTYTSDAQGAPGHWLVERVPLVLARNELARGRPKKSSTPGIATNLP